MQNSPPRDSHGSKATTNKLCIPENLNTSDQEPKNKNVEKGDSFPTNTDQAAYRSLTQPKLESSSKSPNSKVQTHEGFDVQKSASQQHANVKHEAQQIIKMYVPPSHHFHPTLNSLFTFSITVNPQSRAIFPRKIEVCKITTC